MFVNCSNHPSSSWTADQKTEAEKWGRIVDISFPQVPAAADEEKIQEMTDSMIAKIISLHPCAVMCQGEFTLTYAIVGELLRRGIHVVSACSERDVIEERQPDGSNRKIARFRFVRFRTYQAGKPFHNGGLRKICVDDWIREGAS